MADLPIDSAGELAAELAGDGVRVTVQTFSNTAISEDVGTNARLRTIEQTQAIPAKSTQVFDDGSTLTTNADGTFSSTNATESPGVGAGRDDSSSATVNSTQQYINDSFNGPITPQPNVLDKYASYTYQLSWYLLTPDQYNGLSTTNKINTNQWQLLVQSGGAPTATTGTAYSNFTQNTTTGRSQYFPYDYYLDNLVLENSLLGKGAHSAVNLTALQFKVTEPNGITLINNLYAAISNLYKANNVGEDVSYQTAQHVMGIRFFGYDEKGNLVQANNKSGDPSAIVEKYYPFALTGLTFRMANRVIEYTCVGSVLNYTVGLSSRRGTIPHPYALAGQTLSELFNGKQGNSADQVSNDDGRKETASAPSSSNESNPAPQSDSAQSASLFSDSSRYNSAAGWSI